MIRALILLMGLTACTDPHLGAAIDLGPGGVSVAPYVTGEVGGAHVTVSR